jgi:8-oxo-dGTP diphosphatase
MSHTPRVDHRRLRQPSPYRSLVDVCLILTRADLVLLALRQNTGHFDGFWNLPSGKLEEGEDALAALVREAREEIGVRLDRSELSLVATVHCRYPQADGRLGLFFVAEGDPDRQGETRNAEPHKCAGLDWFPLTALPENLVAYNAAGLDLYRSGEPYGAFGWEVP